MITLVPLPMIKTKAIRCGYWCVATWGTTIRRPMNMPFADIGSCVSLVFECLGDWHVSRRKSGVVHQDAMAQGVEPRQQWSSVGGTLGAAGNRVIKTDTLSLKTIKAWRMTLINIRRCSPLICKNKNYIFRGFHCWIKWRKVLTVLFLYSYTIVYWFDQSIHALGLEGFLNEGIIDSGIFAVLVNQRFQSDSFLELA